MACGGCAERRQQIAEGFRNIKAGKSAAPQVEAIKRSIGQDLRAITNRIVRKPK